MTAERSQLEAWYREHSDAVRRALRVQGFSEDVTEDACAEAFAILARVGTGRIDPERGPRAWLRKVARNAALDLVGHGQEQAVSLDAERACGGGGKGPVTLGETIPDTGPDVVEQLADRETLDAIGYLSRGQRTALLGRMAGLSYDEIAEQTGHTYTWVNRHTTEGRKALRDRTGR